MNSFTSCGHFVPRAHSGVFDIAAIQSFSSRTGINLNVAGFNLEQHQNLHHYHPYHHRHRNILHWYDLALHTPNTDGYLRDLWANQTTTLQA